jgi:hypothetical protein
MTGHCTVPEPNPRTECALKKLLGVVAIAFAVFYMMTQPNEAADAVRGAVSIVGDAFESFVTFVTALFE